MALSVGGRDANAIKSDSTDEGIPVYWVWSRVPGLPRSSVSMMTAPHELEEVLLEFLPPQGR
jgi:hypothetical protein